MSTERSPEWLRDVTMDFAYGESFTESIPEAYERLILEAHEMLARDGRSWRRP
ncbi:hypothetical protein [Streptomyces tailanensis]|uniref:hypothetical protein n=1 Tax=Streptomyces tailanensis TaxID=2569858 RepID=UPI00155A558C|nr:hypothetical protein [Streptomyces tailanensis]